MPELPEVQTVVDQLIARNLAGDTIISGRVFWKKTLAELSMPQFLHHVKNTTIEDIRRRGKFIVLEISGPHTLLIHLRMTGRLYLAGPDHLPQKHEQVVLELQSGKHLVFYDPRKFGRFYLTPAPEKKLRHLGPEPLSTGFTTKVLARRLNARKRMLKPLLLDQRFIAGLGNIYVDEALWHSRLHPLRRSHTLTPREIAALYRCIRKVLRQGVQNGGTTLGQGGATFYAAPGAKGRNRRALKVFRKAGQPCPRCKTIIERLLVGRRSTFICCRCQPADPKIPRRQIHPTGPVPHGR